MKLKIIIILTVVLVTACAGGTRGTGATIDRRFTDMPTGKTHTQEKSLYDTLFAPECDEDDEDCE